jgi:RNA-directed DNA polymerase
MLERIVSRSNMRAAYDRVVGNKGCAGIDDMEASDLKSFLKENWDSIKASVQYFAQRVGSRT